MTDSASSAAYFVVAKSLIVLSTVSHCKYETRTAVTDSQNPTVYYIVAKTTHSVLSSVRHCKYETRTNVGNSQSPTAYCIVLNTVLYCLALSVTANMRLK